MYMFLLLRFVECSYALHFFVNSITYFLVLRNAKSIDEIYSNKTKNHTVGVD